MLWLSNSSCWVCTLPDAVRKVVLRNEVAQRGRARERVDARGAEEEARPLQIHSGSIASSPKPIVFLLWGYLKMAVFRKSCDLRLPILLPAIVTALS